MAHRDPRSFVTVTHPALDVSARVPATAVKHMEPNGWTVAAPADTAPEAPPAQVGTPAKSAPKSEWTAHAAALGVNDPDQLTKDELVDLITNDTEEN